MTTKLAKLIVALNLNGKMKDVVKGNLPVQLKKKVFGPYILPIVTQSANKLRVAQRGMEKTILGIERVDKVPNNIIIYYKWR